jgi:hypothetical protein
MATEKQKLAAKKIMENHGNVSKTMLEVGYDENTAKNPKNLTDSKGWKELMDKHLPDNLLTQKHKELLEQKQLAYFVFSKKLENEEIEEHMLANGLDLIVIRETDKGKMAFYSITDANARKNALDMAYKLKGLYASEKLDLGATDDLKDYLLKLNKLLG